MTAAETAEACKRYKKRDFSEFCRAEDVAAAKSKGAFTSRAYDRVSAATGDAKLAKVAYAAALGAWAMHS